ncbi:MAG: hypothetical protein H6Q14_1018 [Bacteroidetes bacterium]|nr:hypothetical protein [Bacteroidota bacterium]
MNQNLISASLSAEDVNIINEAIATLKEKMPFLSTIQKKEVGSLFKVGTNYQPFLDLAKQTADMHPEILPGVFDMEEFAKDYALYKSMLSVAQQIGQLNESVQKALIAVGSDSIDGALEVYATVKQNKDKVPGLSVAYEAMALFFKRPRTKSADK